MYSTVTETRYFKDVWFHTIVYISMCNSSSHLQM